MQSYREVFEALEKDHVQFLVVGGVAMNLHGCARFTNDLDILLALDHVNLEAMKKAMKALGYRERLPIALDELGDEKKALKLLHEKNLIAFTFIHPTEPLYSVDILVGASLQFSKYEAHCVHLDVWGMNIPVVSIDDLIALKSGTSREKDAIDIEFLLQYKGL